MTDEIIPEPDPNAQQPDAEPDRHAQPVDAEQPPRLAFPVVGVGASAGGIDAFGAFLDAMRPDGGMAFVFILHLPPDAESHLAGILGRRTAMPVRQVEDGMPVEPDRVYVIRPGHVLTIRNGHLRLGPELGGPRAANRPVDDFFRSLAEEQRERAVCVILSGMGSNGTAGAQAVKAVGGLCVAQAPESADYPSMPQHLIDAGYADHVLRPAEIPAVLLTYADSPYATGGREADAGPVLDKEGHHLREVLAVLRTRAKQDFNGYKRPTLLRRIQRRMGLARLNTIAEYAKLLRQTPSEVTALADDLLIHVTGFFRDPEAWDALRRHVIAPLVAARAPGAAVRAWVAACSSGEEAYSLAMLLVEEAERAGKPLDVKVFATDLADRTLAHARAGVYPGGIESEIGPERRERFFTREAEQYRVRTDLRDRVVFAPQNILQDPPFSRLDIATCRNLLIYLEPDVQKRVLHLLHFGLREGGALFLGSSETVGGIDGLFEVVDKKSRIYRRVGPTRHGAVDFPLPHSLAVEHRPARVGSSPPLRRGDAPPVPVPELTRQALLDAHTPPAVTVDRDGHAVYYHGDVGQYLRLAGEPTRELLLLVREGVRGAVRAALQRAATENARATVPDGWVDRESGRRHRVGVTTSPVADPAAGDRPAAHFVVSFIDHGEVPLPGADGSPDAGGWDAEVRRLRGELQGTIEELQSSNEELKASNEEVTSVNEELQSTNEELETSKEEQQSLNEELTTVNSQLRIKADEYQAASSDLASLLASTDIAVLFLDTSFRIRRFTPAARDLIDLISGDVGRPLTALARKFDDPHLDADCRAVLERLVSAEREVAGTGGRHYLRRVLPYRTTDNRIDGVVVTFVDITARKQAEQSLADELGTMTRLHDLTERLQSIPDLPRALGEVLDAAIALFGADRGTIQVRAPETDMLRYAATRGFDAAVLAAVPPIDRDFHSTCAVAIRTGGRVVAPDILGDSRWADHAPTAAALGYAAAVSAPMKTRREDLQGVLTVHFQRPRTPSERTLHWLDLYARLAAHLVERGRAETALREGQIWLTGQKEAFQIAMSERPLAESLGVLVRTAIEQLNDGARAAFYMIPSGGEGLHLITGMSEAYAQAINGFKVGPESLACGLAMHKGEPVITPDVETEPRWENWRELARAFGYRGCWSFPVQAEGGTPMGTFALYFREPREPLARDLELAGVMAHTAAIIISRHNATAERAAAEAALRAGEGKYRTLFESIDEGFCTFDMIFDDGGPRRLPVRRVQPGVRAPHGSDERRRAHRPRVRARPGSPLVRNLRPRGHDR